MELFALGEGCLRVARDGEGFGLEGAFEDLREGLVGVGRVGDEFDVGFDLFGEFLFATFFFAIALAFEEGEEGGLPDFEGETDGRRLGDDFADGWRFVVFHEVDAAAPLDQELEFDDMSGTAPGDYYYVRVNQLDGGRAWSSPWWVGEKKREPQTGAAAR